MKLFIILLLCVTVYARMLKQNFGNVENVEKVEKVENVTITTNSIITTKSLESIEYWAVKYMQIEI